MDGDRLAAEAHRPLDVVLGDVLVLRLLRVLEHDHVAALRVADVVERLEHQHAVAGAVRRARVQVVDRGPGSGSSGSSSRTSGILLPGRLVPLDLVVRVDRELVAALRAGDDLLVAVERLGHRPGGDDERLGDEELEEQDQDDDEDDRLDHLAGRVAGVGAVASSFACSSAVRSSVRQHPACRASTADEFATRSREHSDETRSDG